MASEILRATARPFLLTSVGKKFVMGVTGAIWALFVAGHMSGNMLMFISKDAYNIYGHMLTSGEVIYIIETVLTLAFIVHVICAVSLTLENRAARGPQGYAVVAKGVKAASKASRLMAVQGSIVLVFLILHLASFKFGTYYETEVHGVKMRDLHRLMVEIFKQPGYVVWYSVALVLLGLHLSHGVGSVFQSLGFKNSQSQKWIPKVSLIYGIVVALGFLTQPIYILLFAE